MTARQIGASLAGLLAILLAALLLSALLSTIGKAALGLPSPIGDVVILIDFVAYFFLCVVLFLAIPEALLLHRLGVRAAWPFFAIGALSGPLFEVVQYLHFRLTVATADRPAPAVFPGLLDLMTAHVLRDFLAATPVRTLLVLAAVGAMVCGLAWRSTPYYLGGRPRDWESRILGVRPPYAG